MSDQTGERHQVFTSMVLPILRATRGAGTQFFVKVLFACLNRTYVAGWVLEVLVGHCTHFGLVYRDVLCVFHSCYRFIQRHYLQPAMIWAEVRYELRAFRGIMLFVASFWEWQWSNTVYAVDASLSGYGVVQSWWSLDKVREVGRVNERSRYRLGAETARRHALERGVFLSCPKLS